MNIKEGMYVRYENRLIQLKNVEKGTIGYFIRLAGCIRVCVSYKDTYEEVIFQYKQAASTPMELIKVGDLVKINKTFGMVGRINFNNNHPYLKLVGQNSGTQLAVNNITKILTPNTNGGFDLQWESEKE